MQNKLVALSMHIAENPNDAAAYVERGRLCESKGMVDKALQDYTKAISLDPDFDEPYYYRAVLHKSMGETKSAKGDCEKFLDLRPLAVSGLHLLSNIQKFKKGDALFRKVEEAYKDRSSIRENSRPLIIYDMAKYYSDIGEVDKAFEIYTEGATLLKNLHKYESSQTDFTFKVLKNIFPDGFKLPESQPEPGSTPIFIVGLPRSGTTLLESMIGEHSKAHPAGELKSLPHALGDLKQYMGGNFHLNRKAYLSDIRALSDKPYVIDKLPYNFVHIPFIKMMFPNAPIIHIQRNPLDTLISCFTTLFVEGNAWTYDLEDLGHYYNHYKSLMDHWRQHIPNAFIDVNYEDLVENPEVELKRILDYCGLEWEAQCLEFHKSNKVVKTVSNIQVRQPLYKSAIGRAEKYKKHLQPLIEAIS